jgi:hypothetical protein
MKKLMTVMAVAAAVAFGVTPVAQAETCPLLIKQLTERVEKMSDSNFKKGRAQRLIAEAQKLHDQGKHAESMQMVEDAVGSLR